MIHTDHQPFVELWRRGTESIRIDRYEWDAEHFNCEVWYHDSAINLWQPVAFVIDWADAVEAATREARRRA